MRHDGFVSDPSPDFLAALEALRKLGSTDLAARAFASAVAPEIEEHFLRSHRVRLGRGGTARLIGADGHQCREPLALDHGHLYYRGGRGVAYVAHVYGLTAKHAREVLDFGTRHGLEVTFSAGDDWYFPSQTIRVELWTPGERDGR